VASPSGRAYTREVAEGLLGDKLEYDKAYPEEPERNAQPMPGSYSPVDNITEDKRMEMWILSEKTRLI